MKDIEEYKKIQDQIVQHLFDQAKKVSKEDLKNLIKKPESELDYHLDVLVDNRKLIQRDNITSGNSHITGFSITKEGRKYIMEK